MFLFESNQDKKIREQVEKQFEYCLKYTQQKDQSKYLKSMQVISKHIQNNNQKAIQKVVDQIKITIKEQQIQPVKKYQAIKLLRDLMKIQIKNKSQNLGKYVVKKILKRLTILAAHKSNSHDQERGRDIFKNIKKGQQKYSILFLNQLLLSIQEWAKTWPGASQGTKKEFNQAYRQLITSGVQFPKQIVRVPLQQSYRGQQKSKNSVSPYNSIAQKQSLQKIQQKRVIKKQTQKPVKKSRSSKESGLNQKQVQAHFESLRQLLGFFVETLKGSTQMNNEQWDLVKSIIQALPQMTNKGNQFVIQVAQQDLQTNFYIKKISQTFKFQQSISKDIRKTDKNISQFPLFKKKYLKLSNSLIQSLKEKPKKQQQSKFQQSKNQTNKVQTSKVQSSKVQSSKQVIKVQNKKLQQKNKSNSQEINNKRLSVPKIRASNIYNSISGQGNQWVIQSKEQYNSGNNKIQTQNNQKFGSFGIGGIGQKIKKQNQIQKSAFAQKSNQSQSKKSQEQQKSRQLPKKEQSNQINQGKILRKESKQAPNVSKNKQIKNDFFNEQNKNSFSNEQKPQNTDESSNFFGNFGQKNVGNNDKLPEFNRDNRRMKVKTVKNSAQNINEQNPFQINLNQNQNQSQNNFSAFNKDKSSLSVSKNPFNNQLSITQVNKTQKRDSQKSFQLNPFDKQIFDKNSITSSKLKKSQNQQNFWEGQNQFSQNEKIEKKQNPFSDNASVTQRSQMSVNPFQQTQLSKKGNGMKNPFQDDNKSQLSKQNRTIKNFQINQSFVKSQKQNPFQTSQLENDKIKQTNDNPFVINTDFSKKQNSQIQFKPVPNQKFISVSQRASFRNIPKFQNKDLSIDNPFQSKTIKSIQKNQNPRESWNFSIKQMQQKNQGFGFDQFQNISKANNRQSKETSDFKPRKDSIFSQSNNKSKSFKNSNPFQNTNSKEEKKNQQNQQSIHFSHFGNQNSFNNFQKQAQQQQKSEKSINFDDFNNISSKKNNQISSKIQSKKNGFNDFQITKNDFFNETKKQFKENKQFFDAKSQRSQFSGFNVNFDNKSQRKSQNRSQSKNNKTGFEWQNFDNFNKPSINIQQEQRKFESKKQIIYENIDRSYEQKAIQNFDPNTLKINLIQNNSNYHSPNFNVKYDSLGNTQNIIQSMSNMKQGAQQSKLKNEQSLSIQFEQFIPLEKKGSKWNPLGVQIQHYSSRIYNVQLYDIEQKKKQMLYYKTMYLKQKQLIQSAKQVYNQARQIYLNKLKKIDQIIKQQQSYKKILLNLRQSNHSKQEQIYSINERIKKVSLLKQKILQKQKLLFEKTKMMNIQQQNDKNKIRANNNKWQIFNRNLKIMRQRDNQNLIRNTTIKNTYSLAL